jgi:hypothetical protein
MRVANRSSNARRKADVVGRLEGKLSKEEANYRPQDNTESKKTCFDCVYYENEGEAISMCKRVAGMVEANDLCDLWAARMGYKL